MQQGEIDEPVHPANMAPASRGEVPVMRSKADDLTVWQSVRRYRNVGYIAMLAAFCASLDGYRKTPVHHVETDT